MSLETSTHLRSASDDFDHRRGDDSPETCLLVGVELAERARHASGPRRSDSGFSQEESMEELTELVASAGGEVLGSVTQTRARFDPATLIGRGKADEIGHLAAELEPDLILFDHDLTPTQQRNLERILDCRVIDRTQLILDIFAKHARTSEGKLQVELAQLVYLLPRLTGRGVEMSRLGGGIGTRGPGETQLETDRRRISRRIEKLEADLERVRSTRQLQRKKRSAVPLATVALVGYTNAGKSTLFNSLTQANVFADARMFATLDPTIRFLDLPSRRRVLLSDTVGFIRQLPPSLIRAFRATLEEVTQGAMILHVLDVSSPHRREYRQEVRRILTELEAHERPVILVLNKVDLVDADEMAAAVEAERADRSAVDVVAVSARGGDGIPALVEAIDRHLPLDPIVTESYRFRHDEGDKISFLYEHAHVVERKDEASGVEIVAEVPESVRVRFAAHVASPAAD